jgi:hypothetical protein
MYDRYKRCLALNFKIISGAGFIHVNSNCLARCCVIILCTRAGKQFAVPSAVVLKALKDTAHVITAIYFSFCVEAK